MLTAWLEQPGGPEICAALDRSEWLVTSALTRIECERAFHRHRAQDAADPIGVARLQARAREVFQQCEMLDFDDAICERASQAFPSEPIRALDALHMAFFERARQAFRDVALLSLDKRVRAVAAALSFPLLPA